MMNKVWIIILLIAFGIGALTTPPPTTAQVDPNSITSVTWSPDGSKIAVASLDSTIEIWDSSGTTLITTLYEYTTQIISDVAWSPDSQMLAGVSLYNTVNVWHVASGEIHVQLVVEGLEDNDYTFDDIFSVAWSPDGSKLAVGSLLGEHTLYIWETETWQEIARPAGMSSVEFMQWRPDGLRLAVVTGGAISIWNAETWVREMIYRDYGHPILFLAKWNISGTKIASGSADGTAHIIDAETAQTLLILQHSAIDLTGFDAIVWDVAWSPDNTMIATTGADGTVKIWDASTGELITTYVVSGQKILSVDWSPDGQYLAYGGEGGIFDIIPAPELLICDFEAGDYNELTNAITAANTIQTPQTICVQDNTEFLLNNQGNLNALPTIIGDITITPAILGNISIKGNQATLTRDDTADLFRFFEVAPGGSLTLNNLTLSNGAVDAQGGAILNNGTLTINDSTLLDNYAHHSGGAIYNTGSLTINNSGPLCSP